MRKPNKYITINISQKFFQKEKRRINIPRENKMFLDFVHLFCRHREALLLKISIENIFFSVFENQISFL